MDTVTAAVAEIVEDVAPPLTRVAFWTFSPKGGIGKTTLERGLRALARRHGVSSAAFDGEGTEGQLTQYEGMRDEQGRLLDQQMQLFVRQDPLAGCVPFDVKDVRQRDLLVNIAQNPYDLVFVDFPGGTLDQIKAIGCGDDTVAEIIGYWNDAGFKVIILVPIGPLRYSIKAIGKAVDVFKGAEVLVAMMGAYVDSIDDFIQYFGYEDAQGTLRGGGNRRKLLDAGGREMYVEKLSARTYALLDELSLPFDKALDSDLVPDADKMRIRGYLKLLRKALPPDLRQVICGDTDAL